MLTEGEGAGPMGPQASDYQQNRASGGDFNSSWATMTAPTENWEDDSCSLLGNSSKSDVLVTSQTDNKVDGVMESPTDEAHWIQMEANL